MALEAFQGWDKWAKLFWVFLKKIEALNFFENTQKCFAYISATRYCSEAVLYSKRTAGYPLITSYNEANHKNYDNRKNGDDPKNENYPKSEEDLKKQRQPQKTKAT